MVASKQLRLAVETEEECRTRLENDAATKWVRLAMEMDEEKSKTGEDGSYHTAQVDSGYRGRKEKKRLYSRWD